MCDFPFIPQLLTPEAAVPERVCWGGNTRRVKPWSAQKNKFHLVPGTKRQPAKPPARAPAQRTHGSLKFQLVAASIRSPHPRVPDGICKWQRQAMPWPESRLRRVPSPLPLNQDYQVPGLHFWLCFRVGTISCGTRGRQDQA